jgi:hypothetical protein
VLAVGRARAGVLLREVGDGVWRRVLAAKTADKRIIGLAGFGEGVVARVEVFALLELVLEEVLLVGELAVEAEELLFFFGEGLVGWDISWSALWVGLLMEANVAPSDMYVRSRPPCSSGAGSSLRFVYACSQVSGCW